MVWDADPVHRLTLTREDDLMTLTRPEPEPLRVERTDTATTIEPPSSDLFALAYSAAAPLDGGPWLWVLLDCEPARDAAIAAGSALDRVTAEADASRALTGAMWATA